MEARRTLSSNSRHLARTQGRASPVPVRRLSEGLGGRGARMSDDLRRLSNELGPQFARAVLENKERERGEREIEQVPERTRDIERGR